ncbi:MAG: hypothetical protein KBG28_09050 [Kofleriaceae bacterium]|nr:hypothetical protein [Kofleriaceae bacterium]MBP6838863.1 hypothetical protein [Kofleriaceae bacterium]MBP9204096.1 hypothetical protein [Kofleriaceae bacterium]
MAEDAPKPGPVALRIKLRCDTIDAFIERYAPLLGRSGMFLQSRSPKPIGTELRFDLRLADDRPALVGLGTVREVRPFDPDAPRAPHGMLVTFTRVTRDSREVLLRAIAHRREHGLEDDAAGMPVLDAIPRAALSTEPSAPVLTSGPVPTAPADAEMTGSLPLATPLPELSQRVTAPVAALAPEPGRPRRPRPSEVAASALGAAHATSPDLEEDVDLAAVLGRARALVGDDVDGALAELELAVTGRHERAAAPEAVLSIAEVSARLSTLTGVTVARAARTAAARAPVADDDAILAEGTGDRLPAGAATAGDDGAEHTDIRTAPDLAGLAGRGERSGGPEHTIIGVAPAGPGARAVAEVVETSETSQIVALGDGPGEVVAAEAADAEAAQAEVDDVAAEAVALQDGAGAEADGADADADGVDAEADGVGAEADDVGADDVGAHAEVAAAPHQADREPSADAIAIDDDFEILAEADEADADLMAASGEADAADVAPGGSDPSGLDEAAQAAWADADEAALDAAEAEAARVLADSHGAALEPTAAPATPADPLAGSLFIVDVDTPPAGTRLPSADDFAARLDLGDDGDEDTQFANRPRRADSGSDLYIAAGDLAGGGADIDVLEDDLPPVSGDIYDRLPAVAGAELDDEFEEGPRAPIHRLPPEFVARIAAEASAADDLDLALAGLDERTGHGRAAPRAPTDDGVSIDIDLDDVDDR